LAFVKGDAWGSKKDQWPALVWMRYSAPLRLGKIGYSTWDTDDVPKIAEVIGSKNCSTTTSTTTTTTWTVLLRIENTGFTKAKEFRSWFIPMENRIPFQCIGLRWPEAGVGDEVEAGSITLWEWA